MTDVVPSATEYEPEPILEDPDDTPPPTPVEDGVTPAAQAG
jgi:hypothetical protein